MGKWAQLVVGPAGSGKSTYCHAVHDYCNADKRLTHVVNLDPAAENFKYPVSVDIRDLISVDDVSETLNLGPNGALIFCMEYLIENIDWLEKQIGEFEDDYLIIDCPGQIELYHHIPIMRKLACHLEKWGYNMCCVYILDCTFMADISKFVSGMLACLSAMIQLELPHISLLSKVDLLESEDKKQELVEEFLDPDMAGIIGRLKQECKVNGGGREYKQLTCAIADMLQSFNMVSFLPWVAHDEEIVANVLAHVDHCLQYGEDKEPKDPLSWHPNSDELIDFSYEQQGKQFQELRNDARKLDSIQEEG